MRSLRNGIFFALLASGLMLLITAKAALAEEDFDKPHKIVIQVSTSDPATQNMALNNAVNILKALGPDQASVEIVAYGPGLSLMTPASEASKRIPDLAMQEITFSACGNTIKKVTKKTGKEPRLVEGVRIVPAGVVRIMELQEQGYAYIRP